jgi:hypothetical protein
MADPININSLFADILPDPAAEMRQEQSDLLSVLGTVGGVAALNAPQQAQQLRYAAGGLFGVDTRTQSEKLREQLGSAMQDTSPQGLIKTAELIQSVNPEKAAELRGAAASMQQQMLQQKQANEAKASILASSQDLLRANGKTELADRLPDLFAENPLKAREFVVEQIKTPVLNTDVRDRKIKDLTNQLIRTQGLNEVEAADKAANIVDGVIRMEYLEDGSVVELNEATGKANRVAFNPTIPVGAQDAPSAEPYEIPEGESLLEAVEKGTGFVNIIPEVVGRFLSNIEPSALSEEKTNARRTLMAADNALIRAFSLNPRYPVAEQERIRENYSIAPSYTDSPASGRLAVLKLDSFIERELSTLNERIQDPATPPDQINADNKLISELNAFRKTLFPAPVTTSNIQTVDDVKALSKARLNNLVQNATREELELLPENVLNAIQEAM